MAAVVDRCYAPRAGGGELCSPVAVPVGALPRQARGAEIVCRVVVGAQWGDEGKGHPERPTFRRLRGCHSCTGSTGEPAWLISSSSGPSGATRAKGRSLTS